MPCEEVLIGLVYFLSAEVVLLFGMMHATVLVVVDGGMWVGSV